MTDHYQASLDACRLSEAATWKSDPDRAIQAAQAVKNWLTGKEPQ